ncbi:hypothetical protein AB1Y20_003519 [Prymnesium parvum]|uniref:Glycosyltransferase family 28 N-terminal domain-containing protein n=1 Tax=Prymnesium parvum TaxID=97485 RepID=A0AB34J427_PRYPA
MPAPSQQTLLPTRRVAMYLVGSRGDVQPFISLILKLKQQVEIDATKFGPAVVRVYVPAEFESLLRPFTMDGQAFSFKVLPHFEVKKRMQTDPDVRAAMTTGNNKDIGKLLLRKTFLDHMNKDAFVALHDMMEFKPDVIVYNYAACLYGDTIAQILKIPAVLIGMQMMGSYSSVEAPWALDPKVAKRLPGWAIRIFWSLMLMDMYKKTLAMKEYTFALRKANSLPPLSFKEYKAIVFGKRAGS